VTFDSLGGFYVVSRFKDIDYMYSHPELFSSRMEFIFFRRDSPLWPEMERRYKERGFLPLLTLVVEDPPAHDVQRALVDRVFTVPNVKSIEPQITAIVDELIETIAAKGRGDLMPELAVHVPLSVIADQMGVKKEDRQRLKLYGDVTTERLNPHISPERELEIVDLIIEFQQFVHSQALEYEKNPSGVLLSKLVHAEVEGQRLDPRALVNIMHQILVAGHETTTSAIGSAILTLLERPDLRSQLAADFKLIPNFVEEVLRLHPPVLSGFRIAVQDTQLQGVKIPKGSMVVASHVCANYDPAQWENPNTVDPARKKLRQHMTFGRGIHYCIGNVLARTEIRIVIERLLTKLPGLRLDPNAAVPRWARMFHAHRLESLNVEC
jgi:cytochrome P450